MPKQEDFRLRPLGRSDLPLVLEWRNSDRVRANMYSDHVIAMDEHVAWFDGLQRKKKTIVQIFEHFSKPLGVVNITDIDKKNEKCSWGFYLGDVSAPRGFSSIMGFLSLEYIFEVLKMRKLCGEVLAFNAKSVHYHERLGFTVEGRLARHVFKNGVYEDVVCMALFNDTWADNKEKLRELCFFDGIER
jgi:UDP-4-amino-4,6-dideoxy-N-acetyl-beta-L-altrosamine N-acetyltransferase